MKQVITYQAPSGLEMDICRACEREFTLNQRWPRDCNGQEYCTVSHGLHAGDCAVCRQRDEFLRAFADGIGMSELQAAEQWAGFSRMLSYRDRTETELDGKTAGREQAAMFLRLYPDA